MADDLIDVQKKLLSYDQKLISLMISRFELISYMADAKFVLTEEKEAIKIKDFEKRKKTLDFFQKQSEMMAKEKDFVCQKDFIDFISKMTENMIDFSWKYQSEYLKKRYGIKKTK